MNRLLIMLLAFSFMAPTVLGAPSPNSDAAKASALFHSMCSGAIGSVDRGVVSTDFLAQVTNTAVKLFGAENAKSLFKSYDFKGTYKKLSDFRKAHPELNPNEVCKEFKKSEDGVDITKDLLNVMKEKEDVEVHEKDKTNTADNTEPKAPSVNFSPNYCKSKDEINFKSEEDCGLDKSAVGLNDALEGILSLHAYRTKPNPNGRFSKENCKCLKKTKRDFTQEEITVTNQKLRDMVVKKAGERLLNQYASNYEDVSYYLNTQQGVLGGKHQGDMKYALLCNKTEPLKGAIQKKCKEKDIPIAQGVERGKDFFKSLNLPADDDFGKSLIALGNEIQTHKGEISGKPAVMSRLQYDQVRDALRREEPEVLFIDTLISEVMKDNKLSRIVGRAMKDSHLNMNDKAKLPVHALQEVLFDKAESSRVAEIIKKVEAKLTIVFPKKRDRIKELVSFGSKPEALESALQVSMGLNPSLKHLLKNTELFEKVAHNLDKSESIIDVLEGKKEVITKHFREQCDEFREEFAALACLGDSELMKSVPASELEKLIGKEETDLGSPELVDQIMCQRTQLSTSSKTLKSLATPAPFSNSDYVISKKNPNAQTPFLNTFRKLGDPENADVRNYATDITRKYEADRDVAVRSFEPNLSGEYSVRNIPSESNTLKLQAASGSFSSPISETSSGDNAQVKSTFASTNEVRAQEEVSPSIDPVGSSAQFTPVQNNNYLVPPTLSNSSQEASEEKTKVDRSLASVPEDEIPASFQKFSPEKKDLASVLEKRMSQEDLMDKISSIGNKDAVELSQLRKEREEDKKIISDLQLAAEKKESERLRKEYEDLDKKYQTLLKGQSSGQISGNGSTSGIDKLGGSTLNPEGEESSVADNGTQGVVPGQANFNPSKTGQNVIADPRISSVGNEKGAITVDLRQNEGKDREEEVYKILESTEDSKILEEIQKSGMTYMYKVVEGDQVKEIVETIAFKNLNPKLQELVLKKLEKKQQVSLVELQLKEAKRKFAAQALRLELLLLDHQAKRRTH